MTKSQALAIKYMTHKELYKIYRLQGITASVALNNVRLRKEIAIGVLTEGSFLQHFNQHHGI